MSIPKLVNVSAGQVVYAKEQGGSREEPYCAQGGGAVDSGFSKFKNFIGLAGLPEGEALMGEKAASLYNNLSICAEINNKLVLARDYCSKADAMMKLTSASLSNAGAPLALALLMGASSATFAADYFDGQQLGVFTERHYSERDRPWRDKSSDPKIDNLAKTGLRSLRADVNSIRAEDLDAALAQARGSDLPVLAFLDVEAKSDTIDLHTMVRIEMALRLQFLSSDDGSVLGESSDFDEVKGLDIEQALPELVEVSSIATMAEEAGRKACKSG